ncbi:MAG: hypothetical protein ACKO24_16070 [Leptolyngbyaceae cyanobacterium]
MTNPANDIFKQAGQGSVAAIIQVLNHAFSNDGVRTRAFFADGVLQLLCEAPTVEQLDQEPLVERVRQELEEIAPRNIRRVNINSRIIREQQLLWLDEIHRDPKTLLWSQEILLNKPNVFKQLVTDLKDRQTCDEGPKFKPSRPSLRTSREKRQFWRGLAGGAGLMALILTGWAIYHQLSKMNAPNAAGGSIASKPLPASTQATITTAPVTTAPAVDPFAKAVRLAQQAAETGKTAQQPEEWKALADRWQQASDLMGQVSSTDPRYALAQDRLLLYRKNSVSALEAAKRLAGGETTKTSSNPN